MTPTASPLHATPPPYAPLPEHASFPPPYSDTPTPFYSTRRFFDASRFRRVNTILHELLLFFILFSRIILCALLTLRRIRYCESHYAIFTRPRDREVKRYAAKREALYLITRLPSAAITPLPPRQRRYEAASRDICQYRRISPPY